MRRSPLAGDNARALKVRGCLGGLRYEGLACAPLAAAGRGSRNAGLRGALSADREVVERRHEERRWPCPSRLPGSALTKASRAPRIERVASGVVTVACPRVGACT